MTSDEAIKILMAKANEIMDIALVIKTLKKDSEELKNYKCLQQNGSTFIYAIDRQNSKISVTTSKVEGPAIIDEEEEVIMEKPILRKDGRYMQRFSFQGKRICVYGKTEYKCKTKARSKRKELKNQAKEQTKQNNLITNNNKTTLNAWFLYWATFKKQQVKESTWIRVEEYYNRNLKGIIGDKLLGSITPEILQDLINNLVSHSIRKKITSQLRDLFATAYKSGKIKADPMALVVLPKQNLDDRPLDFSKHNNILTYENEKKLLPQLKGAKCYYATKFILYTGIRRGEALGLMWKDVDWEKEQITIQRQIALTTKKITSPKTKAAYREIPLLPQAMEVLLELSSHNRSNNNDDFIFTEVNRLSQQLSYYAKITGIAVTPHMLRHTFASRCYAAGLDPKIMQQILGHEDISTSLNIYTHILDQTNKEVIEQMKKFFTAKGLINYRT